MFRTVDLKLLSLSFWPASSIDWSERLSTMPSGLLMQAISRSLNRDPRFCLVASLGAWTANMAFVCIVQDVSRLVARRITRDKTSLAVSTSLAYRAAYSPRLWLMTASALMIHDVHKRQRAIWMAVIVSWVCTGFKV